MRPAEKILYGGSYHARSRIDPKLLAGIREEFRAAFESVA
jgi:hypothetical protein